jgi:hypothetical protein
MPNVLVVTAHPGDFVWRAGGAIALHAKAGHKVHIVCLAFGERGESQGAWAKPGATLEIVKAGRKDEAEKAAAALGASIEFYDAGDYPLITTPAMLDRLVDTFRALRPEFVLTHAASDPRPGGHPRRVVALCSALRRRLLAEARQGGRLPHRFHAAIAEAGWLGICMPQEYGGSGLGITEATIMMRTIAASGAGMSGASAIHMNMFGLHPVVVHGTPNRRRAAAADHQGREKACFGVTEPNTGLNTTQLKTRAVRKGDRYVVNGQKVWISTAQVAHKILLLARTTPLEEVKKPGHGLSLFYTDLDRSRIEVREIEKLGRKSSTPTSCSSTTSRFRSRTASARKARASSTSCTA